MKRKILASILALSMIFSMVPTAAFADDETGSDSQTQIVETKKDETVDEQKSDEQKSDEQKSDEQKTDEQKSDEQKTDEQKSDEQKTDEQKADVQKSDEQKSNEQKTDEPRSQDDENSEGRMMRQARLPEPTDGSMPTPEPNVAMIDSIAYSSLQKAIDAATAGQIVNLREDTTEDITIDKNITLDLGGKTLTNTGAGKATITVENGATVTIKNGSVMGGASYYNIEIKGTATLENVTATAGNDGSSMIRVLGNLKIYSGTYTGGMNVVKTEPNSTMEINGGEFEINWAKAWNDNAVILTYGKTTINGGIFTQAATAPYNGCPQVLMTGEDGGVIGELSVYDGTFINNHTNSSAKIAHWLGKATPDKINIYGGTFNKKVSDYCMAPGLETFKDSDGSYHVREEVIATIGSTNYKTLQDAVDAANNGDTIKIAKSFTLNSGIKIEKDLTLDLNRQTITTADGYAFDIYSNFNVKNGKLTITNKSGKSIALIWVNGTANATFEKNVTINTAANTFGIAFDSSCTAASVTYKGTIKGSGSGITMNGLIAADSQNKLVVDGANINVSEYGIYQAGDSATEFTLKNSTITGKTTGIEIRAGKLNVENCKITGNGKFSVIANPGGTTTKGAGIAIAQHTTKLPIEVKISGGSIKGEYALYESNPQGNSADNIAKVKIEVTGGELTGKIYSEDVEKFISGGKFSIEPDAKYLAENFEAVKNAETNMYEVGKHDPASEKVADKVEPTCTETGKKEYYKCNTCGKLYLLNEDGTYTEVTKADDLVIPALGHKMTKHEEVKATCTEKGMKAYYECSTCGKLYEDEAGTKEVTDKNTLVIDIDATNHKTKFVAEVAAGCEKEGVKAHYECERCGKLFTDAEGKNEVKAADLVIGATGHHWGEWKVVKAATTREAGIEQAICDYCGGPWQKEIPVRATASTGTATRPSNSGSTATKGNSSSSTSSTKENANPTKADTSVADVKRSEEVVSAVKENVKVADEKATVDKDLINKVKGEKGAAVVLPIASATGESVTSTEIAKDAVKAVMDNGSDLIVELTDATVKLDNETLKAVYAQAEGDSIEIRAVKTEVASLTEAQKKALDNYDTAVVVELQIYSNGKYIANFNGGIATIKIPFTPAEGVSADEYTVYYVGGDGKLTAVASEYVDGYMIISTGHFSSYAIVRTAEKVADSSSASSQPREQTGSSFPVVPVVIAVVALICLFVLLRKKNKED